MIPKRVDKNGNSLKYKDWIFFFNKGGEGCKFSFHEIFIVPRYGERGFIELKKLLGFKTIETKTFIPSLCLNDGFLISKSKMPKKFKIMVQNGVNIFKSKNTSIYCDEKINIDNYMKRIDIEKEFEVYKSQGYFR